MKQITRFLFVFFALSSSVFAEPGIENYCHQDGAFLQCNFVHDQDVSAFTMGIVNVAHIELSLREEAARIVDIFRNDGIYAPPVMGKVSLTRTNAPAIELNVELAPTIKIQNMHVTEVLLNVTKLEGALPGWLLAKAKKYLNESPQISQVLSKLINDAIDNNGLLKAHYKMDDVRVDLVDILKTEGIDTQLAAKVPGNESKVSIGNAFATLHDQGLTAYVHFEIDAKQKNNFPFVGWTTVWSFFTNIAAEADISPSCEVTNVDVRKWGTHTSGLGSIVQPLIDGLYNTIGEHYAEYALRKGLTKVLRQNEELRGFCELN